MKKIVTFDYASAALEGERLMEALLRELIDTEWYVHHLMPLVLGKLKKRQNHKRAVSQIIGFLLKNNNRMGHDGTMQSTTNQWSVNGVVQAREAFVSKIREWSRSNQVKVLVSDTDLQFDISWASNAEVVCIGPGHTWAQLQASFGNELSFKVMPPPLPSAVELYMQDQLADITSVLGFPDTNVLLKTQARDLLERTMIEWNEDPNRTHGGSVRIHKKLLC